MQKPELLMPAGSLKKLELAYQYGADAVYLGVPFYSLRARENEFSLENLEKGIKHAHSLNKKVYVTCNIFARNRKLGVFYRHLDEWVKLKPDAFIMSDPGLMMMVREKYPELPIHLSVQANCMNWQSVKFWRKHFGLERVILSRELNLNEIKEIKDRVPDIELEAFVHGAICIAYSGRCLMSSYFSNRDANQGVCDNSCRENFNVYSAPNVETDREFYLEDLRNRGEFYRINEDENGTYIMNAKDLCLIEYIKEIADAGVCSLKVEGRTKSEYYVSMVSRAYRKAIDDMAEGKPFDTKLLGELAKVANRGYSTGFMIQAPDSQAQKYDSSFSRHFTQKFAGLVSQETAPEGFIPVNVRNKIRKGDRIEVLTQDFDTTYEFTVSEIRDPKNNVVETAHGGTGLFFFAAPDENLRQKTTADSILSLKSSL